MANRFWVGGTATWDATAGSKWSTTSGGAGGSAIPGTGDVAIFDGGSGAAVVTVASSIGGTNTIQTITFTGTGNFTGTLDFATNNPSITLSVQLSLSGSGARTVNLGSGTFTLNAGNGAVLDATTSTSLTLNPGTATILINGAINNTRAINLGTSLSWPTITVANSGSNGWSTGMSAATAATIANLNFTAPVIINLQNSITYTVTNQFTWAGTAFNNAIDIRSSVNTTPTVAAASGSTLNWCSLSGIVFSGTAVNATNSFDLKGNNMNGGSITGPSGGVVGVIGS